MFIYFVEQVWNTDGFVGWNQLGETTWETQHRYWDAWHEKGYKHYSVYPYDHMDIDNDYIDF